MLLRLSIWSCASRIVDDAELYLSGFAGDIDTGVVESYCGGIVEREGRLRWWFIFVELVECCDRRFIVVVAVAVWSCWCWLATCRANMS